MRLEQLLILLGIGNHRRCNSHDDLLERKAWPTLIPAIKTVYCQN